jgi:ABC-type dipeptide/oligopeptide/nickel transport system permease subunit
MAMVEAESAPPHAESRPSASARVWRRLAGQPVALGAGIVLVVLFVIGALAPVIVPGGAKIDLTESGRNVAPTLNGWHLFGTDGIGQDMLVRTLYGLHTSEQSAIAATLLATVVGVVLGSLAGYRGGWVDAVVMRLADLLAVFPALMIFLAVYTYFTTVTAWKATFAFACFVWIPVARVVRAEISSLRGREFVQAALSLGASDRRIFFRHLLPNASGTIIVAATSVLGLVFVLEATLEFFGLGVSTAIEATLGNLIGDGQRGVFELGEGWWTWAGPASVLVVVVVCVNLVGDGLADALRTNRRR